MNSDISCCKISQDFLSLSFLLEHEETNGGDEMFDVKWLTICKGSETDYKCQNYYGPHQKHIQKFLLQTR